VRNIFMRSIPANERKATDVVKVVALFNEQLETQFATCFYEMNYRISTVAPTVKSSPLRIQPSGMWLGAVAVRSQ
jgi:hypothetical protein